MPTEILPNTFIARLHDIVPKHYLDACLQSFTQIPQPCLRINTLKTTINATLTQLDQLKIDYQPIPWLAYAFHISAAQKSQLTHTELHTKGHIYLQNLSSMLPIYLLAPQPHERNLDLAAAPGGKTLQTACHMQNQGWISAVESVKSRFFKLKANIDNHNVTCAHVYLMDGIRVWRKCPEQFDRVLVDTPCSSESRFHIDSPASYQYWSEKKIKALSRKQYQLLYSGIQSLKPGGTLLYATCTYAPEENEAIISRILKKFPDAIETVPITLPIDNVQPGLTQWKAKHYDERVTQAVRILPNSSMDAFFMCHLKKTKSTINAPKTK